MTSKNAAALGAIMSGLWMAAMLAFGQPTVVLPERFKDAPVVVENSPQFKALAAHNKKLQAQLAKEQSDWKWYSYDVERRLRDEAERAAKAEAELAQLKATQSHSRTGIVSTLFGAFSLGVSFFSNPATFIIGFLIKLGVGLAAIVAFYFLVRYLWRRFRKRT
jgi:Flp pilus assembly protein TadB